MKNRILSINARQVAIKNDFWDEVSKVAMEKPHTDHFSSVFSLSQGEEDENMHLFTSVWKEEVDRMTVILPCPTLFPCSLSTFWCLRWICTNCNFAKLLKIYEQQNQNQVIMDMQNQCHLLSLLVHQQDLAKPIPTSTSGNVLFRISEQRSLFQLYH